VDQYAVVQLMGHLRTGDHDAARELVDAFYPELRRMAAARMRNEKPDHTWQPTVLVHELYVELTRLRGLKIRSYKEEEEKAAFLNLAGAMMRRLLIHHARPLYRRAKKVDIDSVQDLGQNGLEALADVENVLERLAAVDPNMESVVVMRVFEGLTGDEIAGRLNCSPRTVANYWDFARHWLRKEWAGKPAA
jgi:RNA polymerase sigma factor (TIGR02999 family)